MKKSLNLSLLRIFVFTLISSLLACNKGSIGLESSTVDPVSVENGRLVFKDIKSLDNTLSELRKLYRQEDVINWEKKYNYTSLRSYNLNNPSDTHLSDMDLPIEFKAILNPNGEYVVGDQIVWFNKGYNYFIHNRDEALLKSTKANPSSYKSKYAILTKNIDLRSPYKVDGTIARNALDARYQKIWAPNGQSGPWRKTVYEIVSYTINEYEGGSGETNYTYGLKLRVKLEWWSGGNHWEANAGETRVIDNLYLYGSVRGWCGVATPSTINLNLTSTSYYTNYNLEAGLATGTGIAGNSCLDQLVFTINGNINTHSNWDNNTYQTASTYNVSGSLWEN